MEANLTGGWYVRGHEFANGVEYGSELLIVFGFEGSELSVEIGMRSYELAEAYKGAQDLDVDENSAFAAEHTG